MCIKFVQNKFTKTEHYKMAKKSRGWKPNSFHSLPNSIGPKTGYFDGSGVRCDMEQGTGIEPALTAWEAAVIPIYQPCKVI